MKGHVTMNLAELDLNALQEAADFVYDRGVIGKQIDMRAHVDLRYLRKAEESWWRRPEAEPSILETAQKP